MEGGNCHLHRLQFLWLLLLLLLLLLLSLSLFLLWLDVGNLVSFVTKAEGGDEKGVSGKKGVMVGSENRSRWMTEGRGRRKGTKMKEECLSISTEHTERRE